MGCSSSSAQTVEQEKRPGTKPEESNGDTVVRNGIIAEDVRTIEDPMQLPVQTASPDDATAGPEDEAVLEAVEAEEDLGSGEDLLADPEAPAAGEELAPQPPVQEEVAVTVTKVLSPVEETLPVETISAEAPSEVKAVETLEKTPEAQPVEAEQTEVPVLVKEEIPVLVVEESAGTAGVPEEGVAEEASKAATEDANPVQDEAPTGSTSLETDLAAAEASAPTTDSAADEDATPTEPSRPANAAIDTTIAAVSIPEMPPVTAAAAAAAQAEPHSATDEETEVSTVSSDVAASPEEASGPVEVSVPEPVEAPPVAVNPESRTETAVPAEIPEGTQTEAPAGPEPATEPVPETPPEVSSVNEASKDNDDEIAKKED